MEKCETRVRITTKAMRLIPLAASCLIAHGAYAAEIQWNSSHGGDMQAETNWRNNTKPTSSDYIKIALNNDKPITLSEDLTATGGNSSFAANFELALTNETGVSKTLSLKRIHHGGGSKTVRLTAGNLSFNDHLYMGDWSASYRDDTLIVDGASAVLSGGNSDIYVGSSYPGHTLVATNGATVSSRSLYVGRNNQALGTAPNRFYATNELCRVTGSGTTADFPLLLYVGSAGGNRLEIDDGATVSAVGLYVGYSNYQYNSKDPTRYDDGSFVGEAAAVVSGGATLMLTNTTTSVVNNKSFVGAYSMSNRLEIVDGGKLITVTNLFRVGGVDYLSDFATFRPGYVYSGNKMLVSGEGSCVIMRGGSGSGIWVGSKIAPDCSVTVENGATWASYGEFKVADGSVTNATLRVASGASLSHYVYSLNIGTSANAKNAALEIDNASVESVEKGINVTGDGSHVSISGANSRFAAATTTTFATGTRLEVEIPKDGFTGGEPPITCATLTFNAGSSLVVTLEKANNPGGRVVLARTTNNITTLGNLSATLPDGVELDTSNAKELAVKIKSSGLVIVFR